MEKYLDLNYYDYDLDESFIAQTPLKKRTESKLLVLDRFNGNITHKSFSDITSFLHTGDVLVLNDTKVLPARLYGMKENTEAHIEILLLKDNGNNKWDTIIRNSRRLKENDIIVFDENLLKAKVLDKKDDGIIEIELLYQGILYEILDKLGEMPIPPYITRKLPKNEQDLYQTVYAKAVGSAAAPTAGLHFDNELLEKIKNKGVIITYVTLHVGLGTFRPVSENNILEHKMHSEYYIMNSDTANILNKASSEGRKIIAVGTTSTRVLETVVAKYNEFRECSGDTDIFIYPGFKYKAVDSLITNFHLPKSTLMMLVSALAGRDSIMNAYEEAKKHNYRFFSFGDAMLIDYNKKKQSYWLKELKKQQEEKPFIKTKGIKIYQGENNILLSAPHAFKHLRKGKSKNNEYNTSNLIKLLHKYTKCHIIYTYKEKDFDANYDINSEYKSLLSAYIKENNIKYFIDIHGTLDNTYTIEIGTNKYQNVLNDQNLIKDVIKIFNASGIHKIVVDKQFKASGNTLASYVANTCNIKSMQIEIASDYRKLKKKPLKFNKVLRSIDELIEYLKEG